MVCAIRCTHSFLKLLKEDVTMNVLPLDAFSVLNNQNVGISLVFFFFETLGVCLLKDTQVKLLF